MKRAGTTEASHCGVALKASHDAVSRDDLLGVVNEHQAPLQPDGPVNFIQRLRRTSDNRRDPIKRFEEIDITGRIGRKPW